MTTHATLNNVNPAINQRHVTITVVMLFLISVIEGVDIQAAGIAANSLTQHFAISKAQLGLFLSAGILGLLPGSMLGGYLADKIGRKKVLLWSVGTFGVFTLLTIWMTGLSTLSLVRFIAGIGIGMSIPNLVALAVESVQPQHRSRTVGLMYAGMPLGCATLALLSVNQLGNNWQHIFIAGGVLPLILLPLLAIFLPESADFLAKKSKVAVTVPANSFKRLMSEGYLGYTLLLGVSFFFNAMIIYIMISWLPSLFKELGFNHQQGSIAQALFMGSAAIGVIVLTRLLDKWNKRVFLIAVYAGIIIGLFGLNAANSIYQMYLAVMIMGLFLLGSQGVILALSGIAFPTTIRSTGVGMVASIGRIGSILGPVAAGLVLNAGSGPATIILYCIIGIIIAAICMIMVVKKPADDILAVAA